MPQPCPEYGHTLDLRRVDGGLLAQARVKIETRQQADLMRIAETNVVRANATRLRKEIGWLPRIPLQQTLTDILEYWRQQP